MRINFLLFVFVFFSSCTIGNYEWCVKNYSDFFCIENGKGQIFLVENEQISIDLIAKLEIAIMATKEVFSLEWKEDKIEEALLNVNLFAYLPFEKVAYFPCDAEKHGGCFDSANKRIWSSSTKKEYVTEENQFVYKPRHVCFSAFIHEIIHALEWEIEQKLDYHHADKIYRWSTLGYFAELECERKIANYGFLDGF
jgi:hypothetical protein